MLSFFGGGGGGGGAVCIVILYNQVTPFFFWLERGYRFFGNAFFLKSYGVQENLLFFFFFFLGGGGGVWGRHFRLQIFFRLHKVKFIIFCSKK